MDTHTKRLTPSYHSNPLTQAELELGPHGEIRDLKNIEFVLSDVVGDALLSKYMGYNESMATTATNHDPWFPGCPVFDHINKDPRDGCNFIRFHKDCESTDTFLLCGALLFDPPDSTEHAT